VPGVAVRFVIVGGGPSLFVHPALAEAMADAAD
jgi:hypothetical protein